MLSAASIMPYCNTGKSLPLSYSDQKQLFKRQNHYIEHFGAAEDSTFHVIKNKNLTRVYNFGTLREVGEESKNQRTGAWYFFNDTLGLKYIVIFRTNGSDTILNPYSIINQRW